VSTTTTDWQQPQPNVPPTPEEPASEKGLDIFSAVMGRKFLVVLFLGIGVALGYLHYTHQPAVYASFAKVMVLRPPVAFSEDAADRTKGSASSVDHLDNHQYLLTQPKLLKDAIEPPLPANATEDEKRAAKDNSLLKLPSLAEAGNAVQAISAGLKVTRSEVSDDVLEIVYMGPNAGDCKKVLDAVLESYKRWLQSTQQGNQAELEQILLSGKQDLERRIKENREAYSEFRQGAKLLFQGDRGVNYYEDRLKKVEEERHLKMLEMQQLQVQFDAMNEALSRGASKEALLLMANMLERENQQNHSQSTDGVIVRMDPVLKELMPMMLERETLLESFGEGHPQVRKLEKRIEAVRSIFQENQATGQKKDLLSIHLESMTERIGSLKKEGDQLNIAFETAKAESKKMQADLLRDSQLTEEHAQLKQWFDTLVQKLNKFDVTKGSSGLRADVTEDPTPGRQIGPSMVQSLGLGGVGGLLTAIAIALLLETADKSFRNPDEISKQLRLPVIGHIPELAADRDWKIVKDNKVDSSISVHHRPKSRLAESYRAVRAALFFGFRGQTHHVLQVTSANSGDGKTTLCCNLAAAVAMSGKKCLLVDCDLRRPRVHKLFGLSLDVGVSSVVRDGMDVPDAVQSTLVPNLDVMTVGPRVDNPAELLLSPQFTHVVQQMREKYDFVLMDTPPILIVTDPAAVAAHVDGVILVVRNTKRSRPQTRRVRETLDLIGARVLGVVVNGISERSAGYGYGDSYSYNYTTSYRSGAGKYYSDERVGNSYYEESRKRR